MALPEVIIKRVVQLREVIMPCMGRHFMLYTYLSGGGCFALGDPAESHVCYVYLVWRAWHVLCLLCAAVLVCTCVCTVHAHYIPGPTSKQSESEASPSLSRMSRPPDLDLRGVSHIEPSKDTQPSEGSVSEEVTEVTLRKVDQSPSSSEPSWRHQCSSR